MTRHLNITTGIFLSFIIHAIAFATWQSDFDLDFKGSVPSISGVNNQISIQLVKYIEPVAKVINTALVNTVIVNKVLVNKNRTLVKKITSAADQKIIKPADKVVEETNQELDVAQEEVQAVEHFDEITNDLKNMSRLADKVDALSQQIEIDLEKQRQEYLQRLLAHIESYKFYPGAARRRSIEGTLDVAFFLDQEGEAYQLTINGGRTVLQRAVRQALNDAQPFPKPPSTLKMNEQIAFSMVYELE